MLIFAYGSNISVKRLQARTPSARPQGMATLPGYRLLFHQLGGDGSGKCHIAQTGLAGDKVIGMIYELSPAEKPILDRFEGLGQRYSEQELRLIGADSIEVAATAYLGLHIRDGLKPFHWYKEHVLRGAREHAFPQPYIAMIDAIESREDPDQNRHLREMAHYR